MKNAIYVFWVDLIQIFLFCICFWDDLVKSLPLRISKILIRLTNRFLKKFHSRKNSEVNQNFPQTKSIKEGNHQFKIHLIKKRENNFKIKIKVRLIYKTKCIKFKMKLKNWKILEATIKMNAWTVNIVL